MIIQPNPYKYNPNQLKLSSLGTKLDDNDPKYWIFNEKFSRRILDLKKLKKDAANEIPPDRKNYNSLSIYNEVLMRIIEVIAENNLHLKNDKLTILQMNNYEDSNRELNLYYQKYFDKYCKTPNIKTCKELIKSEFLSIFYTPPLTKEIIVQKKMLADAGYSMIHEVKEWLNSPISAHDFPTHIQEEMNDFIIWAKDHPRIASLLGADIALTCSVLLGEEPSRCILNSINAMIYTKIFLDALGLCSDRVQIEDKKLLKFRALADFISYSPMLATAIQTTTKGLRGNFPSFASFALNTATGAGVTILAQEIARKIPNGHEKLTALIISILRGHDLQNIILEQRNLTLAQLAGTFGALIKNQDGLFKVFKISFKTVVKAKGEEKNYRIFSQVMLPALAVTFFVSSFFIPCTATLTIPWFLLSLSYYLTNSINSGSGYKLYDSVITKLDKKNENQELLRLKSYLLTNVDKRKIIQQEVIHYRNDLQNKFALPKFIQSKPHLNEATNQLANNLKAKYLKKLDDKFNLNFFSITAPNIVSLFNKVVDVKKIREKLANRKINDFEEVISSTVAHLMDTWLQSHLEEAFLERSIDLYRTKHNGEPSQSVDDYLEKVLKPEVIKNPSIYESMQNNSLLAKDHKPRW